MAVHCPAKNSCIRRSRYYFLSVSGVLVDDFCKYIHTHGKAEVRSYYEQPRKTLNSVSRNLLAIQGDSSLSERTPRLS